MNTFYQINISTIFLQSGVLIFKLIKNDDIVKQIPIFASVVSGLLLLHAYQQKKLDKFYIQTILLINILVVNMFWEDQSLNNAKYFIAGRFFLKYTKSHKQIIAFSILIIGCFILEAAFYATWIYTSIVVGWIILFLTVPGLLWTKSQVKDDHRLSHDITLLRDIHQQEQKPLQEQGDPDTSQSKFPSEFYQSMLQMYPEGIMIIDQSQDALFMSDSLKRILGTRNKDAILSQVFSLKNCNHEIKQQEKVNNMFQALTSKLSSNYEQLQSDQDEHIDHQSALSDSLYVRNEYDRIMLDIKTGTYQNKSQKLQFLFEVSMICTRESSPREGLLSSAHKQNQLFEVTLRPFIYFEKPYIFAIIKDVTHFNQIRVLQSLNQNKTQMLAQVSHEFRTPLNCIILLVENLQEQVSQEVNEEYLKPILITSNSLLSLINDLLDIVQLKAGKFKLVHTKMDLKELLIEIQKFLQPQLSQKGNKLELKALTSLKAEIYSDPNRIRQIIFNLLGNANKFTKDGKITINLDQISHNQYQVSVTDTGLGIDQKDFNKLFQAFGKLDQNKEVNAQGIGLGLMISNVLAERLATPDDGNINVIQPLGLQVKSDGAGKGSAFSFVVLDQQEYMNSSKYKVKIGDDHSLIEKKTSIKRTKTKLARQFGDQFLKNDLLIIIVDDEPFNIMALNKSLNKKFTLEGFYSGHDLIKRLQEPLPSHTIILQDLEMPEMDGFEITKLVRSQFQDQVYIIGCSAHQDTLKQACISAGMDNYLQKPVRLNDLMKIIDQLF